MSNGVALTFVAVFYFDSAEDMQDTSRYFTIFKIFKIFSFFATCVQPYEVLFTPSGARYVTSSPFSILTHPTPTQYQCNAQTTHTTHATHATHAACATTII